MIDNDGDVWSVNSTYPESTRNAKNQKGTSTSRADTRKESEQKRRIIEAQYFDEVITLLTMSGEKTFSKKMDKVSVLKETAIFLRLYDDLADGRKQREGNLKQPTCLQNGDLAHLSFDAMDAFLMIVSDSGRIFYCTELVTSLLGHMQARLVEQNIFDYVLEQEVPRMKDLFVPWGHPCEDPPNSPIVCYPCREFQCNLKMYNGETGFFPQHLLFQCLSYLRVWKKDILPDLPCSPNESDMPVPRDSNIQSCILLVAKLPTSPSVVDLPISTNEVNFQFDMRISREGKIIDIERKATLVLGYLPGELMGSSFFDYIDPCLVTSVGESITGILSNGLATTVPYRIVSKGGRYLWMISNGTVSYIPWNGKPDHILFSTRVLNYSQVLPENRTNHFRGILLEKDVTCDTHMQQTDTEAPSLAQSEQYLSAAQTSIQLELDRKNQELFNLQCRVLEQQQLMEKERNQFYHMTQQVMQSMTYPRTVVSATPEAGHVQLQHSISEIQTPSANYLKNPAPKPTHFTPDTHFDQQQDFGWS